MLIFLFLLLAIISVFPQSSSPSKLLYITELEKGWRLGKMSQDNEEQKQFKWKIRCHCYLNYCRYSHPGKFLKSLFEPFTCCRPPWTPSLLSRDHFLFWETHDLWCFIFSLRKLKILLTVLNSLVLLYSSLLRTDLVTHQVIFRTQGHRPYCLFL